MTVTVDSALPDGSWDADFADAFVQGLPTDLPPELPPDKTEWINPPQNACPVCGEEVVKEPHMKRRPKYHPECKPQRGKAASDSPRSVRVVAKDRQAAEEVEAVLDRLRSALRKAVLFTAMADPFDALVIHINSDDIVNNCRPLLMRFPALREQGNNASAAGAIFGLVTTVFTTLLPILAHHGLFPIKKLVPLLMNLPMTMLRLKEMSEANGGDMTETLINNVAAAKQRAQEAAMRAASVETVNASFVG